MRKFEGRPVTGTEFFALLNADDEFCAKLGRALLAAGRLETELKRYLKARRPELKLEHANLGALLRLLRKHTLFVQMQVVLGVVKSQRNYLAHNIHALLSDWIEETILERSDLLDSDVTTYCHRAWELSENLNRLADIVQKENSSS
jgi:hypothetical protein